MTEKLRPKSIRKWALCNTKRVATFNVFAIDQHGVVDSEGKARHDVFTFVCPDWCNVIAVTHSGEIVLVWQYRFGTDALSLEIPGGVIDPGEPPEQAARRELLEETGYEADRMEPLLVLEPNPALQANRCHTYVAYGARPTGKTAFDENEELEVVLATEEDILQALDQGLITHSLVYSALETYLRRKRT